MPARVLLTRQGLACSSNLQTRIWQERFLAKHSSGGVTYGPVQAAWRLIHRQRFAYRLPREGRPGSVTRLRLQRQLVDLQDYKYNPKIHLASVPRPALD